jgi:hypothetical protein
MHSASFLARVLAALSRDVSGLLHAFQGPARTSANLCTGLCRSTSRGARRSVCTACTVCVGCPWVSPGLRVVYLGPWVGGTRLRRNRDGTNTRLMTPFCLRPAQACLNPLLVLGMPLSSGSHSRYVMPHFAYRQCAAHTPEWHEKHQNCGMLCNVSHKAIQVTSYNILYNTRSSTTDVACSNSTPSPCFSTVSTFSLSSDLLLYSPS